MNTCDTCKWWNRTTSHQLEIGFGYNFCEHLKCLSCNAYADGFGVTEGEPFNQGSFATGPKFGCIHHEPIDKPANSA